MKIEDHEDHHGLEWGENVVDLNNNKKTQDSETNNKKDKKGCC